MTQLPDNVRAAVERIEWEADRQTIRDYLVRDDGVRNLANEGIEFLQEMSRNAARYEYVRTLAPVHFHRIWLRSIRCKGRFDDLVDAAMLAAAAREG